MVKDEVLQAIRPFTDHYFRVKKGNMKQVVGDCPFCGKEGHFYINPEKGLWDCKVCGARGNLGQYLYKIHRHYVEFLEEQKNEHIYNKLSADRKLPISAFKAWHVGYDPARNMYMTPVFNGTESLCDIKKYTIGKKTMSTPGASSGIFNRNKIAHYDDIYLCEGEWDGMAMDWLLRVNKVNACAVAVSGAQTFKQSWIPLFQGKRVYCMYDHDGAGEKGQLVVRARLSGIASQIKYIHWPDNFPTGFDVRDWIKYGIRVKKPRACLTNLLQYLSADPTMPDYADPEHPTIDEVKKEQQRLPLRKDITNEEVVSIFRKWLYLPDVTVLDIMFGTIFANRLEGDPIWMFLIAPPGGSKSELLMTISNSEATFPVTTLTPSALMSGSNWGPDKDPSLLPRLNNKVLVIKDFTTILSMNATARDEIFGILRDAYDGRIEKYFGNGLKREYRTKFGILAGTTPVIDALSAVNQSLGERFLRYRLPKDSKLSEIEKVNKAMSNVSLELRMRAELCQAAASVIARKSALEVHIPQFSDDIKIKLNALARLCSKLRGVVGREMYTQTLLYDPFQEHGTRIVKQLAKLAAGIGIYRGIRTLGLSEYNCVKSVAMHSCPPAKVRIVKSLYEAKKNDLEMLKTKQLEDATKFPRTTLARELEDMRLLELIDRVEINGNYYWRLNKDIVKLIRKSSAFNNVKLHVYDEKQKIKIKKHV